MSPSDKALVELYAARKDAEAFGQIVRRYAGMVYGSCLRITGNAHDAEDAAQECFLELARHAGSITTSLPGWLHATATNHALMAARKNTTRQRHESRVTPRVATETSWEEVAPLVDRALEQLPEADRLPLVLHFLQGKTQEEVAAELQVSQPTVSRRIEKGIELLRERLKKAGVVAPVAIVATLLGQNAATAAPATLTAALGKMALAGVGSGTSTGVAAPAATTAILGGMSALKIGIIITSTAAVLTVAGIMVAQQKQPAPPAQAAAATQPAAQPAAPSTAPKETMFARGIVVDEAGNPVAGATVYATRVVKGGYAVEFETRTDADGRFSFQGLHCGDGEYDAYHLNYVFLAGKTGLAWGSDLLDIQRRVVGDAPSPLPAGVSDLHIPLSKPGSMAGRVLTKEGQPVQGVPVFPYFGKVALPSGSKNLPFLCATTDAQGQFHLDNLPIGRECGLAIEAAGFAPVTNAMYFEDRLNHLPMFTVGGAAAEIRLAPESQITGRVVYEKDGAPLAGATVSGDDMPRYTIGASTTTAADGSFSLDGLIAARYRLRFCQENVPYRERVPPWLMPYTYVELKEGQTLEGVVLKVLDSVPVTARVLDAVSGEPIEEGNVAVMVNGPNQGGGSQPFTRGVMNLALNRKLQYLEVYATGYVAKPMEILITDQREITLPDIRLEPRSTPERTLEPPTRWQVLVVDEAGRPVPEATLRLVSLPLGLTGPDGRVQYQVPITAGNESSPVLIREPVRGLVATFTPQPSPDGAPPVEEKVVLHTPGTIVGMVKDTLDRPVQGVGVGYGRGELWSTPTDQEGRYTIRNVPAGQDARLYTHADGYGGGSGRVAEVRPGETSSAADIILPIAGQTITGRVTDEDGKPVSLGFVSAYGRATSHTSTTSDAEGRFTLKKIVLEDVTLSVEAAGFARFHMQLPAGEFKDVKVQLQD